MDSKVCLLQKLERLDQHTLAVAHLTHVFQVLGKAAQIVFQDLFILFYELCVFACICMHTTCILVPSEADGTGVKDGCKTSCKF